LLGITGATAITIGGVKFARRGKKYNTKYDEDSQDAINERKIQAQASGAEFKLGDKENNKPKKKSFLKRNKKIVKPAGDHGSVPDDTDKKAMGY
jgi:hypothetical protein